MLLKTILQINTVCGVGSTGRIATDIADTINSDKYKMYIAYGYGNSDRENTIKIGTKLDYIIHNILSRITGRQGRYSYFATKNFLKKVDKIKPDIIHLHNIHGNYINYKLLFEYIKKHNIPVIWTLHDAWAFTGKCVYFDYAQCDKWQDGCYKCKCLNDYPKSIRDNSKKEYENKKKAFTSLNKLTIITPSYWLENLVRKSFLKKYKVITINNGINLEKFKPEKVQKLKHEKKLDNQFIILGVANDWEKRKGLDFFIELARKLPTKYKIIMIGLTKKQIQQLPDNIIKIEKTNSIEELVQYYNMADVLLNPTLEDNFPTTNIEAIACGTPVITFDTGGSPEIVDEKTGVVVEKGNIEELIKAIGEVCSNNLKEEDCIQRAKKFDKKNMLDEYMKKYEKILEENK